MQFALRDDVGFGLVDQAGWGQLEGCDGECCGECWRVANPCPPAPDLPPECTPEPPDEIYVNCAVVCGATGTPVTPGQTFKRGQFCYTVGETIPFEEIPDGATVLEAGAEVECVGGCEDIRCPTQVLWIVGRSCKGLPGPYPAIPACLIDHCTTRSIGGECYTFDPADAQELDPALPVVTLGPEFLDCCDCLTDQQPLGPCSGARAPIDPCNEGGNQTPPCCCHEDDVYEVLSFHAEAEDHFIQHAPVWDGGGRSEADYHWEITMGGPVPGTNGVRYGTRRQTSETRVYDALGNLISTTPYADEVEVYLIPQLCPHLGVSAGYGPDNPGGEGFGFGMFSGLAAPYIICTGSQTIDGGSEEYTGNMARSCTAATFTGSAARTIKFPPAGPGDGSFSRTSSASASWSVRRSPAPGPCANGCGDGTSGVKGKTAIAGRAAAKGGCAGCGGGGGLVGEVI